MLEDNDNNVAGGNIRITPLDTLFLVFIGAWFGIFFASHKSQLGVPSYLGLLNYILLPISTTLFYCAWRKDYGRRSESDEKFAVLRALRFVLLNYSKPWFIWSLTASSFMFYRVAPRSVIIWGFLFLLWYIFSYIFEPEKNKPEEKYMKYMNLFFIVYGIFIIYLLVIYPH